MVYLISIFKLIKIKKKDQKDIKNILVCSSQNINNIKKYIFNTDVIKDRK